MTFDTATILAALPVGAATVAALVKYMVTGPINARLDLHEQADNLIHETQGATLARIERGVERLTDHLLDDSDPIEPHTRE